jgi:hypothetical protein
MQPNSKINTVIELLLEFAITGYNLKEEANQIRIENKIIDQICW